MYERFKNRNLPELCLSMRMASQGTDDSWDDENFKLARSYLEYRLRNWTTFVGEKRRVFDEAVRLLVIATLVETAP